MKIHQWCHFRNFLAHSRIAIVQERLDRTTEYQLQICKERFALQSNLQVVKLRGMYLEDESHSYHISSLMDRKMKDEKLDGNLVKGFGMLRRDNQPRRAKRLSLSSQG